MRIISDFHDYYDGLSDGADTQIWTRRTSVVDIDKNDPDFKYDWKSIPVIGTDSWYVRHGNYYSTDYDVGLNVLVFCGRLIPYWESPDALGYESGSLRQKFTEVTGEPFSPKRYGYHWSKVKRLFALDLPAMYKTLNLKYKTPILTLVRERYGQFRITLNPSLKELDFQKIHDPFWTFQELERFLFNDMVEPQDPSINITDKLKAESHGFNGKYSFRKPPQEKRK